MALAQLAEAAGLNAAAPPQEAWVDGWLIRLSPGKAKRARCVNALRQGNTPLTQLLARCQSSFDAAGLPLILRITPFSQPADLDAQLDSLGWHAFDAADRGHHPAARSSASNAASAPRARVTATVSMRESPTPR